MWDPGIPPCVHREGELFSLVYTLKSEGGQGNGAILRQERGGHGDEKGFFDDKSGESYFKFFDNMEDRISWRERGRAWSETFSCAGIDKIVSWKSESKRLSLDSLECSREWWGGMAEIRNCREKACRQRFQGKGGGSEWVRYWRNILCFSWVLKLEGWRQVDNFFSLTLSDFERFVS